MKTDVIEITALESGIKEALAQTEKAAVYRGLSRKETLRLQLLAEEMMGMLRTIEPGESRAFDVTIELTDDPARIAEYQARAHRH